MKVFLSPLFFRQHFCRHCVRHFYQINPEKWIWQYELERMPPLGRFDERIGFIPDLAVLLMFDEFLIDGQAHERILRKTPFTWLGQWPKVLEVLGSEGVLSIADTDEEVKKVAAIRGSMLRRDMLKPDKWAEALKYHNTLMHQADTAFGEIVNAAGHFNWEFDSAAVPVVKEPAKKLIHTLHGSLTYSGDDLNDIHHRLKEEALSNLRWQLSELNAGLAVSKLLDVAPMFWAPYKHYLKAKSSEAEDAVKAHKQAEAARLFFSVSFPKYRPESIRAFSRLRNDKRLRQLRDEIIAASKCGDVLNPAYPQRVLEEVLKVEKKVGRVRQISGWVSSAIGTALPATGLAASAAGELISKGIERKLRRDWNWFYLISDGTGYS